MKIWRSGADAMAIWKKQNAPTYIIRIDLYGKVSESEPIECDNEWPYARQTWVPPSENPDYKKKWSYWRNIHSEGIFD